MAELRGELGFYIQKSGKLDLIQQLQGNIGVVRLSGKMGATLTSTQISIVSASIPDVIIKEDAEYEFPEYVNLLLSTGATVQFPITGWDLDPDYVDTSVVGTYIHEAFYEVPDYYLGTKPTVFLTMYVKAVLIISGGILNSYTGFNSRTFLSAGNLVISEISKSAKLDVLIVAGGGAGGKGVSTLGNAGGGGAGGVIVQSDYNLIDNNIQLATYQIVVGAGGDGYPHEIFRYNGGDSSLFGLIAVGGGGGAGVSSSSGNTGGSGGGGYGRYPAGGGAGGAGTPNQGNAGGNGIAGTQPWSATGGGGGGAGGAGGVGIANVSGGGAGGSPISNNYRNGNSTNYAQGGKGGEYNSFTPAVGGANTGNGGQGGSLYSPGIAAGGSGIVVIRYSSDYILE
ncbi:MAG: Ig-like domain-containing protein [Bacteroidales bacterium]|nr:Ig-like domain-containing protein [Bacteroidales bacterium]